MIEIIIRIVVIVRMVGLICLCRLVNICYGRVFWLVEFIKSMIIILLNEVIKVKSLLEIMLGRIRGICMWKKVVIGFVFIFVVVWVSEWLKFISVVVIVMIMNGMFRIVWVRMILI